MTAPSIGAPTSMRPEDELQRVRLELERIIDGCKTNWIHDLAAVASTIVHDLDKVRQSVEHKAQPDLFGSMSVQELAAACLGSLSQLDLELSSLTRADWRKLFEKLVVELVRRKQQPTDGTGIKGGAASVCAEGAKGAAAAKGAAGTAGGKSAAGTAASAAAKDHTSRVKAEVDRLWNSTVRGSSSAGSSGGGGASYDSAKQNTEVLELRKRNAALEAELASLTSSLSGRAMTAVVGSSTAGGCGASYDSASYGRSSDPKSVQAEVDRLWETTARSSLHGYSECLLDADEFLRWGAEPSLVLTSLLSRGS